MPHPSLSLLVFLLAVTLEVLLSSKISVHTVLPMDSPKICSDDARGTLAQYYISRNFTRDH